jgi:hypothetical protein
MRYNMKNVVFWIYCIESRMSFPLNRTQPAHVQHLGCAAIDEVLATV